MSGDRSPIDLWPGYLRRSGSGSVPVCHPQLRRVKPTVADAAGGPLQVTRTVDINSIGSPGRTRTYDPAINSRLLYRLSYRGTVEK